MSFALQVRNLPLRRPQGTETRSAPMRGPPKGPDSPGRPPWRSSYLPLHLSSRHRGFNIRHAPLNPRAKPRSRRQPENTQHPGTGRPRPPVVQAATTAQEQTRAHHSNPTKRLGSQHSHALQKGGAQPYDSACRPRPRHCGPARNRRALYGPRLATRLQRYDNPFIGIHT